MICSNCDRLEVYVDDTHHATVLPDREGFPNLMHPPSFVDLTVDGSGLPELRIDGFVGDRKVLSRSFASDPSGDRLLLAADDDTVVADGSDATRVMFRVVDRHGAPRPYVDGEVAFTMSGPATLVGDNPFSFVDNGGVGAVWIRAGEQPGQVRLRAEHADLGSASVSVKIVAAPVPTENVAGR
jgi:beta-galactosidase